MRRRLDEFSKQYTLNGKGIDQLSETINQHLEKIETNTLSPESINQTATGSYRLTAA